MMRKIMPTLTTEQMRPYIATPEQGAGGSYCDAIGEDLLDAAITTHKLIRQEIKYL